MRNTAFLVLSVHYCVRWYGDHPGCGEDGPAAQPAAPPRAQGLRQGEHQQGRAPPLVGSHQLNHHWPHLEDFYQICDTENRS